MAPQDVSAPQNPWLALRTLSGLSQREVERRLGWQKRGHLSLIERGVKPSATQDHQLREFYVAVLRSVGTP